MTKTLAPVFVQFSTLIITMISIRAVILRICRRYSNFNQELEQGKLMAVVDSQK